MRTAAASAWDAAPGEWLVRGVKVQPGSIAGQGSYEYAPAWLKESCKSAISVISEDGFGGSAWPPRLTARRIAAWAGVLGGGGRRNVWLRRRRDVGRWDWCWCRKTAQAFRLSRRFPGCFGCCGFCSSLGRRGLFRHLLFRGSPLFCRFAFSGRPGCSRRPLLLGFLLRRGQGSIDSVIYARMARRQKTPTRSIN